MARTPYRIQRFEPGYTGFVMRSRRRSIPSPVGRGRV